MRVVQVVGRDERVHAIPIHRIIRVRGPYDRPGSPNVDSGDVTLEGNIVIVLSARFDFDKIVTALEAEEDSPPPTTRRGRRNAK